ncbi:hypothetical protein ACFVFQ_06130 [Streptomyces sp. NPDC057743]|uniref:hypothetical protein n=1 Tax=Streptomyces sp. NPDC057743 TaxID=3346236 RepID=UPI0036C64931
MGLVVDACDRCEVRRQADGRWCTQEYLKELVEQYEHCPFADAELRAGKIGRAMQQHPEGISEEDLVKETGLDLGQIEAGIMWQNAEFVRWHRQFGEPDGPDAPPG